MSIEPGIYRHFKGKLYFVAGIGEHTETGEKYVIYYPLYPSECKMWVRPLSFWSEKVEKQEYSGERFVRMARYALPDILPGQKIRSNLQSNSCGKIVQIYCDKIGNASFYSVGQHPSQVEVLVDITEYGNLKTVTWRDFWSFYSICRY